MDDLDDFNRLVGFYRGRGLSESEAYGKAEDRMEEPHHGPSLSTHDSERITEETMKQLMLGLVLGSVVTGGLVDAARLYDSNGQPSAPAGSIQQQDYFRQRQQWLDVTAMRRTQEEALRQQRLSPCVR